MAFVASVLIVSTSVLSVIFIASASEVVIAAIVAGVVVHGSENLKIIFTRLAPEL